MEKYISLPENKPGNIVKWKMKKHSSFSTGTILCLYKLSGHDEIHKLKGTDIGTVVDILQEEGVDIPAGCHILKVQGCQHPIVMKDMCAECGADLRETHGVAGDRKDSTSASIAMVHSVPELIVSEQQAVELGKEDESRLVNSRKLVLLVDLDETLLHTTNDNVPTNLKDVYHFQLWHGRSRLWYHTKFRPGTKKFLDSISQMYELHICTFGARMYAHTMARYLDSEGKYFSHRILSRDECFDARSKTANLKSLFPCGDSMVCIIDDREEVWNFIPNLIQVKPYIFFDGTADINAPPGLDKPGKGGNRETKPKRNVKTIKILKTKVGSEQSQAAEMKAECSDEDSNSKSDLECKGNQAIEQGAETASEIGKKNDKLKRDETEMAEEATSRRDDVKGEEAVVSMDIGENSQDKQCHRHQGLVEETAEEKSPGNTVGNVKEVLAEENECIDVSEVEDIIVEGESSALKEEGEKEIKAAGESEEKSDEMMEEEGKDSNDAGGQTEELTVDQLVGDREERKETDSVDKNEDKTVSPINEKAEIQIDSDQKTEAKIGSVEGSEAHSHSEQEKTSTEKEEEFEEIIEWEDTDDYLLHLEDILTRIHQVYYDMADKVKKSTEAATVPAEESPDLKKIIPYVKKKVLRGTRLVFSSVVPMNQPLEKSRAFYIAKSLGAEVQRDLTQRVGDANDFTTHLVAAKLGTQKVKAALKMKGVQVVTPDWLWACNERWEHVDERLFLLDEKNQHKDGYDSPGVAITNERKKRKAEDIDSESVGALYDTQTGKRVFKKAKSVDENKNNDLFIAREDETDISEQTEQHMDVETETSPRAVGLSAIGPRRFSETINPLYTFSRQDREDMDKEVEELLGDDESDSQDSSHVKRKQNVTVSTPEMEDNSDNSQDSEQTELELRRKVLGVSAESSSEDSLSGDFPKGWKKKTSPKRQYDDNSHLFQIDDPGEANLALLKAAQSSPHYLFDESGSESADSVGSADDEMAAALEDILNK